MTNDMMTRSGPRYSGNIEADAQAAFGLSFPAYSKGFEAGGRIERERADFLEAELERLREESMSWRRVSEHCKEEANALDIRLDHASDVLAEALTVLERLGDGSLGCAEARRLALETFQRLEGRND